MSNEGKALQPTGSRIHCENAYVEVNKCSSRFDVGMLHPIGVSEVSCMHRWQIGRRMCW